MPGNLLTGTSSSLRLLTVEERKELRQRREHLYSIHSTLSNPPSPPPPPPPTTTILQENFVTLIQEMRREFNKFSPPLFMSTAMAAGKAVIDAAYDIKPLVDLFDNFHIMNYDYHGAWETRTHHNAPLCGYYQDTGDDLYFNVICKRFQEMDCTMVRDPALHEPYFYCPSDKIWCGFDDAVSVFEKVCTVLEHDQGTFASSQSGLNCFVILGDALVKQGWFR
ncbi:putative chitinase 2 [Portunus trituberculatus]|uniref:Putative chitinase 2 n=1 Tax=Portunus trituberculatus TaxID=210409 RepID=A0A5B7CPV2_PORTR|nr:putative chitinase 2 [Portunus trituberculatus]